MPPIRQNIQTINILAIMNKILTTAASATLGTSSYVSPEATVTEIHSEGVLCSSLTDGSEGSFLNLEDGGDIF